MLVESAGGKHDTVPGHDPAGRCPCLEDSAGHGVVVDDEILHLGAQQHVDAARAERRQQAADQRVTHDEARSAAALQPVAGKMDENPDRVGKGACGFPDGEEMTDIGAIDHHAAENGELRNWRANSC